MEEIKDVSTSHYLTTAIVTRYNHGTPIGSTNSGKIKD
jgi:hypothetical protein